MNSRPAHQPALRLPPYAEHVPASVSTVFISAGPWAWERAKRWRGKGEPGLVAPPDVDPSTIDWPIRGRNVALIAPDLDRTALVSLVGALMDARPAVLAVLHGPEGQDEMEIIRCRA